ncbi:MAG: oligoendopeptidase F [Bacilli bacterium]|nr:oligoendopeptidase F [Bacilli bacterium]MDD3304690.1 oligoendopeptidase F [Bacilli bacterium]MDD4053258.1 oligoendopeptidase F [Bacilli bacterium]MDD4411218.1 oligoendopeptidase F [Bacilli bacterium]
MEIRLKERSEIEEKYKWDLSIMYKDDMEWNNDFDKLRNDMQEFSKYKGVLGNSSSDLLLALQEKDNLNRRFEKLASYAMRKSDEDTRDMDGAKLKNMIFSLGAEFVEISSFFDPEIISIGRNKIEQFIDEKEALMTYCHYLENIIRFKEHTLSLEEEKIMANASEVLSAPSKIFTMLNNADIKFENIKDEDGNVVELTNGNYSKYISSHDRNVRKDTFKVLYKGYKGLKNTFTEVLIGDIKAHYFESKNRKFYSPLEMSLFNNNIDIKIYYNVIKVVNMNLNKMHKYVKMKKDLLGLEELHMYDFYVALIKEYDIEYTYDEALNLVFKALTPLGEEYIKNTKEAFDKRWVDVYENRGKRTGAYSSFGYDTPPYILLNYNGKLHSVSTIAHELGHSLHSYYSALKQPYIYHEYSIFVAEVASNVNEVLLNMYMIDNAKNRQEKMSLINDFLESVKGSIYRQTMFAEFEKKIYELEKDKKPLTEQAFSDLYYELNKKYYGEDIISDEEIRYEWMRIPHFYYQFYVYQYATGLATAFFIANNIYNGDIAFRDKYIKFLSSGSSDYPVELLKILGVDMKNEKTMQCILDYFDTQIEEFLKLAKEK